MHSQRQSYLEFILAPFFRWWWALITGVATLLSYRLTPQGGYQLGAVAALLLTLVCFTLLFATISVLYRGWLLFRDRYAPLTVQAIQKNRDLGGEWIFVLATGGRMTPGTVVDVHRRLGDLEVPFALVEIVAETAIGTYQAVPRWLAPIHIRDFTAGRFSPAETVVLRHLTATRIREFASVVP
jgi:hypothetical protein